MTIHKTSFTTLFVLGVSIATTGCATDTGTGAAVGAGAGGVIGAVAGAAVGRPLAGAAIGAGTGALVGGAAGNASDAQRAHAQAVAAAGPPLGIAEVVELTRQGLPEQNIINQIQNTRSTFVLSTGDLEYLNANKVSPNVISVMQYQRPRYYYRYGPPPPPPLAIGVGFVR